MCKCVQSLEVLDSWRLMPGFKDDGKLDEKGLIEWVETARQQCSKTKHQIGVDLQIAFMLARAPSDPDGIWPHIAVRNLIERLNNETIDKHIQVGIYNSRGVVSRGIGDGGRQERELAAKYRKMSGAVRAKWPRTATMLHFIADSYDDDAKQWDVDSELHDLRWS